VAFNCQLALMRIGDTELSNQHFHRFERIFRVEKHCRSCDIVVLLTYNCKVRFFNTFNSFSSRFIRNTRRRSARQVEGCHQNWGNSCQLSI
jgi:hypothetical protein